jgi:TonB family protein
MRELKCNSMHIMSKRDLLHLEPLWRKAKLDTGFGGIGRLAKLRTRSGFREPVTLDTFAEGEQRLNIKSLNARENSTVRDSSMQTRSIAVLAVVSAMFMQVPAVPQTQISGNDGRRVVQKVVPGYPSIAKKMNLAGTVKLIAVVAPDGKVISVEPVGGSPLLIQAARDAVAKWKYAPGPGESREPLEFHFSPGAE